MVPEVGYYNQRAIWRNEHFMLDTGSETNVLPDV